MLSLICARINGWVNNDEAGDLRRNRGHYDVTVMIVWRRRTQGCHYLQDQYRLFQHSEMPLSSTVEIGIIYSTDGVLVTHIRVMSYWGWWRLNSPAPRLLCLDCWLNRLFRRTPNKIRTPRFIGLCEGVHRWPVNSPHKEPVTRKLLPFETHTYLCINELSHRCFW